MNPTKKIAIIGAGQAGLQLAMSLHDKPGYEVTLYSARTRDEIATGPLMATAILFDNKRRIERESGLDLWSEKGKPVPGIEIEVRSEAGDLATAFDAPFADGAGMALDFRLKFPALMDEFERRGGNLVIEKTGTDDLERHAAENDLVVVAAGKGPLSKLFERDPDRSPPYTAPMRHITALIVNRDIELSNMAISIVPGSAEIVLLPILAADGSKATSILIFSQTGSSFHQRYDEVNDGEDALAFALDCVRQYCPDYAASLEGAELSDERAYLHGAFTPVVRKPVGRLPSGAIVMGASDCLTLVDPICGNGLNNAVVMTDILSRRIESNTDGCFDSNWINSVFDEFWDYGQNVYVFMRALLEQPSYFGAALEPASRSTNLASDIINGYTDPVAFASWMKDEKTANAHVHSRLAEVGGRQVAPEISRPSKFSDKVTAIKTKCAAAAILLVIIALVLASALCSQVTGELLRIDDRMCYHHVFDCGGKGIGAIA